MSFTELFFPPHCVLCRKSLVVGTTVMLCEHCLSHMGMYQWSIPLTLPATEGAAAALIYSNMVKGAMRRYKFSHKRAYAAWFAEQTLSVLQEYFTLWKPDCITYIPISWWKLRQRGYNQCQPIAEYLAHACGLCCVPFLDKRPFSGTQSKYNAAERKRRAKNAFRLSYKFNPSGKRIVLLDDIWTTGATLSAASKLLHQAGAASVFALAVTKVP